MSGLTKTRWFSDLENADASPPALQPRARPLASPVAAAFRCTPGEGAHECARVGDSKTCTFCTKLKKCKAIALPPARGCPWPPRVRPVLGQQRVPSVARLWGFAGGHTERRDEEPRAVPELVSEDESSTQTQD